MSAYKAALEAAAKEAERLKRVWAAYPTKAIPSITQSFVESAAIIAATIRALPVPAEYAEDVAKAAQRFCEELQEDADGVPQEELRALHKALDAWEAHNG